MIAFRLLLATVHTRVTKRLKQSSTHSVFSPQVRSLEKSLGQVVGDFEMERQRWEARRREEAAQTKVETDGLRRLVALKTKELKNIRKLAQVSGKKGNQKRTRRKRPGFVFLFR